MQTKYDFIVIGGGSGGIAAANRAAEYGASVALIEQNLLGGTCVNVGCVPKKLMWLASQHATQLAHAVEFGFSLGKTSLDWRRLIEQRQAYIQKLHIGYRKRLDKNSIALIKGTASFLDPTTVVVNQDRIQAPHILIATGAQSVWPEIPGAALGIDSDGFFELSSCPERIAVVGAGYIAVELAGMLRAFGAHVSLVYRHDSILRTFDPVLSEQCLQNYRRQGIGSFPNHTPTALAQRNEGLVLICEEAKQVPPVDCVIWAIGRKPNISALQLQNAHVQTTADGKIIVDDLQNTTQPGIYAVGDVANQWQLTPVAIKAGRTLANRLFNGQSTARLDYHNIPTVVFSHPPIASIGLSETQARGKYPEDIKIYQSTFTPMLRAFAANADPFRIKLITQASSDKIIGCHMIGEMADEILQGFAVAIQMGATKKDFDNTFAIHPTIAEELVTLK